MRIITRNSSCSGRISFSRISRSSLAVLLCGCILMGTAACAASSDPVSDTTTSIPETTAASVAEVDSLEARKDVSDELPAGDYDGRKYRILADQYCVADFHMEEDSADVVQSAIYNRNGKIRDRFDVNMVTVTMRHTECASAVQQIIAAHEDAYDIVSLHAIQSGKLVPNGFFHDWKQVKYINPDQPWWNRTAVDNLSIAGQSPLIVGSMNLYYTKAIYVMYYNKKLAEDYNLENVNQLVYNGTWTVDKLMELSTGRWNDVNSNGKADSGDVFGFTVNKSSGASPFAYSFGEMSVSKNDKDMPVLAMNQEKWADMTNTVYKLFFENSNSTFVSENYTDHRKMFNEGRALFFNDIFQTAMTNLREMEDDYGIIPLPKWNVEQKDYYSMSDGGHSEDSIPKTTADTDFVGHITEAICAESWKTVEPAMYDVALKVKGARDRESVELIDLIMESVVLDFGMVYSGGSGMGFSLGNLMAQQNQNFASYYASNSAVWEKKLADMEKNFR